MQKKAYLKLFIITLFIFGCEKENSIIEKEIEQTEITNPIALFLKQSENTKVQSYQNLIKEKSKGTITKSQEQNEDWDTLVDEYGEIIYEKLAILDSTNINTLFPLVDNQTGNLKSWLTGYFDENGSIQVRVKKIESSLEIINSEDLQIDISETIGFVRENSQTHTRNAKQSLGKSIELVCGNEFIWVCAYTVGNEEEQECGWNYNGYRCYNVNTLPEINIDGGGNNPNQGWIDPFDNDDSGTPTGGGGPDNNTDYEEAEEKVIDELTGKAKCVYDKLKSLNGNLFRNTIKVFINDPKYNLTLKVGNCDTTNDACTNATDVNNIILTIEDVSQSSLGIAALILHEGIHAEMHRYVSRFELGVDPNNRARLLQLYAYYKGWASKYQDEDYNWTQVAHHNYMVENYINKIASAIRQFDNNRYPLDYYMAYAWDGLRESGYAAKRLTSQQDTHYSNLRKITDENSESCE